MTRSYMKLFSLLSIAWGQIQGPPGSFPSGKRRVENFGFSDHYGPPGEQNLARREKPLTSQDVQIIYVSFLSTSKVMANLKPAIWINIVVISLNGKDNHHYPLSTNLTLNWNIII